MIVAIVVVRIFFSICKKLKFFFPLTMSELLIIAIILAAIAFTFWYFMNWKIYTISRIETVNAIQKYVKEDGWHIAEDEKHGYVYLMSWKITYLMQSKYRTQRLFGYGYLERSDRAPTGMSVIIFGKTQAIEYIIKQINPIDKTNKESTKIEYMFISGCMFESPSITTTIYDYVPTPSQAPVIDIIVKEFNTKAKARVLITGPVGCKKSEIAWLIAKETGGIICNVWNPCQPGHSVHDIVYHAKTSKDHPLILCLEEVNMMIRSIHDINTQACTDFFRVATYDKNSWNTMLDNISRMNNVILIMTANESRKDLESYTGDGSYLRNGRVSHAFEWNEESAQFDH